MFFLGSVSADHGLYLMNDKPEPDGWLVAGHILNCTKKIEKQDAETENAQTAIEFLDCTTKNIIFCNGEVFLLDRSLLMGGTIITFASDKNYKGYIW